MVHKQRAAGFTLVELLVVIGIIALLISILLPALGRARESAQAIASASNMRSLGQAVALYQSENKGSYVPFGLYGRHSTATSTSPDPAKFVSPTLWELLKLPAQSTVRVCPSAVSRIGGMPGTPADATKTYFTYRYNYIIGGAQPTDATTGPGGLAKKISSGSTPPPQFPGSPDAFFSVVPYKTVRDPSNVILFIDSPGVSMGDITNNAAIQQAALRPANPLMKTVNGEKHQYLTEVAPTHGKIQQTLGANRFYTTGLPVFQGYTNVAYCDGSVRSQFVRGGDHQAEAGSPSMGTTWPTIWTVLPTSRSLVPGSKLDPTLPP
jgi:prepilin-type N-terminal cleavage/methylation domain-containing protein/prepilin-type processing-associated H-X9-DG protein